MKHFRPNVVRGGKAIGLGNNLFLMKGRKHSEGGIDVGENPRTGLEVEDNEVMQVSPKGVKVFSAQPILGGKSPAQYVLEGASPYNVFNAQEDWKKFNGVNDDGTQKKVDNRKEYVTRRLEDYDIFDDDTLALRQRFMESNFVNDSISPAGAKGAYQIMPHIYNAYVKRTGKKGDLTNYEYNKSIRDWLLAEDIAKNKKLMHNDQLPIVKLAKQYGAYNWGSGNLQKYLNNQVAKGIDINNSLDWLEGLPRETRDYINFIVLGKDANKYKTNSIYNQTLKQRGIKELGGEKAENGKFKPFYTSRQRNNYVEKDLESNGGVITPSVVIAESPDIETIERNRYNSARLKESEKFKNEINNARNNFARDYVTPGLLTAASAPALVGSLAAAPLNTLLGIGGGYLGSRVGDKLDNKLNLDPIIFGQGPFSTVGALVGGGIGAKVIPTTKGAINYTNGVLDRTAEVAARMGDEARVAGTLGKNIIKSLTNKNLPLNSRIKQAKYLASKYKEIGHISKQFLDKNSLKYIFNPNNPELAYELPIKYSGESSVEIGANYLRGSAAHKGDVIDQFFGKTNPEHYEYVNVEDLPTDIGNSNGFNFKKYFQEYYPKLKKVKVVKLGTTENKNAFYKDLPEVGKTKHIIDQSPEIRRYFSKKALLDPGHYHSYITNIGNNSFVADNYDIYKYHPGNYKQTWRDINVDKLRMLGLKFIDSRGEPLIYKWQNTINPIYKYGGIHIKPSKRGTFTAAAKKHGMSVQGFASKVLANKNNYSPSLVKKANFARNASKWHKKEYGGDNSIYNSKNYINPKYGYHLGTLDPAYIRDSKYIQPIEENIADEPEVVKAINDFKNKQDYIQYGNDNLEHTKNQFKRSVANKYGEDYNPNIKLNTKEALDIINFYKSYIGSDGMKRILNNQRKKYGDEAVDGLLKAFENSANNPISVYNVDNAETIDSRNYRNQVTGESRSVIGTNETPNFMSEDGYNYDLLSTLAHEIAHHFNNVNSSNAYALNLNENAEYGHNADFNERQADAWALKYLLNHHGIYDSRGNKDITPEQIEKIRQIYPNLRILQQMDDNNKLSEMLNLLASNNTSNKYNNVAKFGTKINKKDMTFDYLLGSNRQLYKLGGCRKKFVGGGDDKNKKKTEKQILEEQSWRATPSYNSKTLNTDNDSYAGGEIEPAVFVARPDPIPNISYSVDTNGISLNTPAPNPLDNRRNQRIARVNNNIGYFQQKSDTASLNKESLKEKGDPIKLNIGLNGISKLRLDEKALATNIIGNTLATGINAVAVASRQFPRNIPLRAVKQNTEYNVEPELNSTRETVAKNERDITDNTASSRVAVNRRQLARNLGNRTINEIYGQKENIENDLVRRNLANIQNVGNQNIANINQWLANKAKFNNEKADAMSEALVAGINNTADAIGDYAVNKRRDKQYRMNLFLEFLKSPYAPGAINSDEAKQIATKLGIIDEYNKYFNV